MSQYHPDVGRAALNVVPCADLEVFTGLHWTDNRLAFFAKCPLMWPNTWELLGTLPELCHTGAIMVDSAPFFLTFQRHLLKWRMEYRQNLSPLSISSEMHQYNGPADLISRLHISLAGDWGNIQKGLSCVDHLSDCSVWIWCLFTIHSLDSVKLQDSVSWFSDSPSPADTGIPEWSLSLEAHVPNYLGYCD